MVGVPSALSMPAWGQGRELAWLPALHDVTILAPTTFFCFYHFLGGGLYLPPFGHILVCPVCCLFINVVLWEQMARLSGENWIPSQTATSPRPHS